MQRMSQTPTRNELNPAQRKTLKAMAHPLNPVVMIGDKGLTPAVLKEIDISLSAHQLIKVRVAGDDRELRIALLAEITDACGALPVQHIGKLLVLYRPDPEKPLLNLDEEKSVKGRSRTSRVDAGDKPVRRRTAKPGDFNPATRARSTRERETGEQAPRARRGEWEDNERPRRPSTRDRKPAEGAAVRNGDRTPTRGASRGTGSASSPTRDRPASAGRTSRSTPRATDRTAPSRTPARRPKRSA